MSGKLPKGWAPARFRDVMRLQERREPINPRRIYKLLGVRWYGNGAFLREERLGDGLSAQSIYRVQPGDVIYNRLFAWKGSFGLVGEDLAGCYVSNEFPLFAARLDRVDPRFLLRVLQHPRTSKRADAFSTGTTSISRNRLGEDDFLHFPLNLPPLAEQHAIAEVLDAVENAIATSDALIERLKAVASSLLIERVANFGTEINSTDIGSVLLEGPKSGLSPVCKDEPPGTGVLKLSAVTAGQLNWPGNVKFADVPQKAVTQFQLKAGDFLVIRGSGSRDIVGSGCRITGPDLPPFPCIFPDLVIRLRANPATVMPQYLAVMWNAPLIREQIRRAAKSTNGIYKINQSDIRELRIPLPSLDVQSKIVTLVDGVSSRVFAEQRLHLQLVSTRTALAQELLSGRLRLPESMIARHRDKPRRAA